MLNLKDISVKYGKITILKDISLRVEEKQVVSIIGANGAGKSSILNSISGLVEPFAGSITFQGLNLKRVPAFKRALMGIVQVPEGRELFPKMTVLENLLMGSMKTKGRDDLNHHMNRILELFPGLRERLEQGAGSLSGGEQQMLAIGRGLMSQPKLLMMDEPSLGLAPIIVSEIFQIISSLKEGGMTTLLVEQNIRKSLTVSDFAYIIENGQIVLQGAGKILLEDEKTKKVYFGLA
jgi:branched-chain amino acid transport system ATP-binding protein